MSFCNCCCFWVSTVLIVIATIVIVIVWSETTKPSIPTFSVVSRSLTGVNITNDHRLSGNWEMKVNVYNTHDDLDIFFQQSPTVDLYYMVYFAETRSSKIASFQLGKNQFSTFDLNFSLTNANVKDEIAQGIAADVADGSISFRIDFTFGLKMKKGWTSGEWWLNVVCSQVKMNTNSSASVTPISLCDASWQPQPCNYD